MNHWIIVSSIVTAIATVAIAVYAVLTYRLSAKIMSVDEAHRKRDEKRDTEHRQEMIDLLKAMVASNILSGPDQPASKNFQEKIDYFEEIFDDK